MNLGKGRGRVLVVDNDRRHIDRIAKLLKPIVGQWSAGEPSDDLPADGAWDLVIANDDALDEASRSRLLETFATRMRQTRLLLAARRRTREDFPFLFGRGRLTNLLAKNEDVDAHELIVTVQKILRGDVFGLEKYFVWGIEPVTLTIQRASQKAEALAFAEQYAEMIGLSPRLANHFFTVIDELVTNALYNAPIDANGERRYAHFSRKEEVVLDPGEQVDVKLCCDGVKLGVAVTDPFGSLSEERVTTYLSKCFRKGDDQVDTKDGGAGLGLYYIFDSLSHFVINIDPGKKTEMIGLLELGSNYREFAKKAKSFNIFVAQ